VTLQQLEITNILDDIIELQSNFLISQPNEKRKALGQYYTGSIVATYMASLVEPTQKKNLTLLDAGAGTGILTACTALHVLEGGCKSLHSVLYELDDEVLPSLEQTLRIISNVFKTKKASFTYEIRCADFVLARPDKIHSEEPFDIAVINPPYFKYSATSSPYAKSASDLYHGDPNIYASFVAIAMASISQKGQLIAITPRSFTNGLYFKGFREYLLTHSSLNLIHIFKHRDKVFKNKESSVLQENIICRYAKGGVSESINIRSSNCDDSIKHAEEAIYPTDLIIDPSNDQRLIRIPETPEDANILRAAETLESTFESSGYFISTGRVVEHRSREFITDDNKSKNSVPLYRPHNITPLLASWSGEHKKDVSFVLNDGYEKHVIKNNNHVLLKRFSSKDEKRRLVATIHLSSMGNNELIGFGNKTNYLGVIGEVLDNVEAYGLAAIFNSSFMDKYFRCISGNTQVNATEIRVMKFPNRQQVKDIGRQVQKLTSIATEEIDQIVNSELNLNHCI
jgi:adenine-specific DNA-methyltransferase